jgi:hypothetical protein
MVQGYLQGASMLIYEAAIYLPLPLQNPQVPNMRRIEQLSKCLQATKSTFDVFLSGDFKQLNMSSVLSFSHASQVLYKLTVLDYPGWDRNLVRETADLIDYFERIANKLDQTIKEVDVHNEVAGNYFSGGETKLRASLIIWKEAIDKTLTPSAGPDPSADSIDPGNGLEPMDFAWFNLPDDIFLSSLFT